MAKRFLYLFFVLLWLLPACSMVPANQGTPVVITVLVPVENSPTPVPPTPVVITVLVPAGTNSSQNQATSTPQQSAASETPVPTPVPTATSGPTCTVLQKLNLRNGPGTAYNPPIGSLPVGAKLVPTGYNPQGTPGGAWVQVQIEGQNQIGWVSAGTQFVDCNLDLTLLSPVNVPPPPKPTPPKIGAGDVDGNNISSFRYSLDYNPNYFVRLYAFRSDNPDEKFKANKDGRDIESVHFFVTSRDGGHTYYQRTERTAGYCIFGGGEPDCNPWVYEGGQYKWKEGGDPVQPGDYTLNMDVTGTDGVVGNWIIKIHIDLPG